MGHPIALKLMLLMWLSIEQSLIDSEPSKPIKTLQIKKAGAETVNEENLENWSPEGQSLNTT